MPPGIASIIFTIGIAGLFYIDRDQHKGVSKALWIPMAWLFFCLSRSPSLWLGMNSTVDIATSYVEGSPLDAIVFEVLEVAALIVLISRRERLGSILRNNWAIWLFFFYAALSISWSDFPLVTLKHWIKGIGDVMMVLIVLTEASVPDAISSLFTRLGFLLVPLSVLFIKYYPQFGRQLTLSWTMDPIGVAQQKNSLGELCDVLGLALLWRFRSAYNDRQDPNRRRRLMALGAVLAMIVWLLWMCNSMTSICALSMASVIMLLSTKPAFRRSPAPLHLLVAGFLGCALYALFFQSSGTLIASVGRNPTLTGRTDIWQAVVSIPNHPLFGAGYESFWLGSRLQAMWAAFPGLQLNEAHNGYIEILLTVGWIGIVLLGVLIATGYRNVIRCCRSNPDMGSLLLAYLFAAVVTGLTEAAFRNMGPPWIVLILAIIAAQATGARKAGHRHPSRTKRPRPALEADSFREEAPVGH